MSKKNELQNGSIGIVNGSVTGNICNVIGRNVEICNVVENNSIRTKVSSADADIDRTTISLGNEQYLVMDMIDGEIYFRANCEKDAFPHVIQLLTEWYNKISQQSDKEGV